VKYLAYGRVLSSAIPLPELEPADPACEAAFTILAVPGAPPEGWTWIQPPASPADGPWIAVAAGRAGYRILFDTGADFVLDAADRIIAVFVDGAPDAALRHRLIDQVLPLALAHGGHLVLHASAVVLATGEAVAFVGPAGAGKSTLAAAFARASGVVLSDDALVIEGRGGALFGVPAYPAVRVRPEMLPVIGDPPGDPAGAKRRAGAAEGLVFARAPAPIARIYALGDALGGGGAVVGRLAPREAVMTLLSHAFLLDTADKDLVAAQFARVADASACVDVKALAYPRALSALPAVRAVVEADLGRA
jgi:hypothetical protein